MLLGAVLFSATPLTLAQQEVPASAISALVMGNGVITLEDNQATEMIIPSYSRFNNSISSTDWIKAHISKKQIILSVDENKSATSRTALLTLRDPEGNTSTLSVTQPGWNITEAAQAAIEASMVKVVRSLDASKHANAKPQNGEGINLSHDGNTATIYHSNYSGFDPTDPDQWPVLEYYFTSATADADKSVEIGKIAYVPRSSGGSQNGNFGKVSIEVATWSEGAEDNLLWTPISDKPYDFKKSTTESHVKIPEEFQKGIRGIRFTVQSGTNEQNSSLCYASCAEMRFFKPATAEAEADKAMFADEVCSKLKDGVTAEQIAAMTDPFYKQLAQLMFDGTYSSENLVSTHEVLKSPSTLAEEMCSPGKLYDQTAGVTGVALTPGSYAIMVSGIPENKGSVELRMVYWHGHEQYQDEEDNTISWHLQDYAAGLVNGLNIINIPVRDRKADHRVEGDQMCLLYINNFDDEAAAAGQKNPVTVHVVGGLYNGILTAYNTNAENQQILDNAVYPCIDVMGSRFHAVWQTNAMKQYAAGQYVRYINVLDQIVMWEHRVLGLDKYNRVPANRTMTYVNYNYYMYQGGRGPTFMYDTQYRVCNPDNLISHDSDAVWGLSHEWGHQHQMAPYFRWTGMAEVTNNIFSAYNVVHMGYPVATDPGRYPRDKWQDYVDRNGNEQPSVMRRIFLDDNYNREITAPDKDGETKTANSGDNIVMSLRSDAAKAAQEGRAFFWNNKLKEFAINQPKYPSKRFANNKTYDNEAQNIVNPRTALNAIEAYSSNNGELILGPYVNLMYYFERNGKPDLFPDMFEAMRQNDFEHGSSVEPGKTTVDKYELLVSIFNGNKAMGCNINKTEQFKELFPNSCWTKEGYIDAPAGTTHNWERNSSPAIMNCIRKLSRICGYNLWSYFERYGVLTVCALEQGDYGIQYYIMTDDMYDEFKADMQALEDAGIIKPLTEEMRAEISSIKATECPQAVFPNDRPILPSDN